MSKLTRLGGAWVLGVALVAACTQQSSDERTLVGDAGGGSAPDGGASLPDTGVLPADTQCGDGIDNDGDGRIDLADPGCASAADDNESDDPPEPGVHQCNDGADNDGDELIDLADPGCASAEDDDESDEAVAPACDDGVDNDNDGFTDFPEDPGCGSTLDDDEVDDFVPLPQCADGTDNDRDGRVDLADPGCVSPADPREDDPEEAPLCSNGLDDDADGVIDFPLEPGCASAGDDTEDDGPTPPACGNGADDDGDARTDYPEDPGCAGIGDRDETDPPVPPACADGADNDRDGAVDYPDDRGCDSASDGSESGSCGMQYDPVELHDGRPMHGTTRGGRFEAQGSCGGRGAAERVFVYRVDRTLEALELTTVDEETELESSIYVRRACLDEDTELACAREEINDGEAGNTLRLNEPPPGDYYIFVDGATGQGGAFVLTASEIALAECLNHLDDDEDGRTDYPFDPGCVDAPDRDETDPDPLPQCADDEDNDRDGLVDFPLDPGCRSAADDDEVDLCGQGLRIFEYPVGEPFILDDTSMGGSNAFSGSCGGLNAVEKVYRYANPFNARITFSVNHEETIENTLVYVRTDCANSLSELDCSAGDAGGMVRKGTVRLDRAGPGDYFVFVDHSFGQGGPIKLSVEVDRLPAGCVDGADNDGDGFTDGDDPGCEGAEDEDERNNPGDPPAACYNGEDDDGDGDTDYPFDVGCQAKGDLDETDPDVLPACANGEDDDEDGRPDFPDDPGCQARGDDTERNPFPPPECGNAIDDDRDGLQDYPFDPGCDAAGDPSEQDPQPAPACTNHVDDDRDGLVDFPFDVGCASAGDRSEEDPVLLPACSNGQDDDGDGLADFPRDPGCIYAADTDEADPAFQPQCANGRDDDGDQRVDWPDDPGCRYAADNNESDEGPILPRCADGVDNDDDGSVDLADLGCVDARDDDEADPDEPPACANGADDDGDGAVDWPDDDGCAAHGDVCEQAGFGLCDGECVDLIANPESCGRCGRTCEIGVECIEGVCGGLYYVEGRGIRMNVAERDILDGGWEQCHRSLYGENAPIAPFLAACDGEFIMYACRPVGQPNFTLIGMGERDVVFRDSGANNNNLNDSNGVSWYFNQGYSIGFVAPGTGVSRNSCDTANAQPESRLCWHTGGGNLNGGYRCGARTDLNGARDWERYIFTSR